MIFLLITAAIAQQTEGLADVTLRNGGVVTGLDEDGIQKFLGVPFAKPPVGPLRFRDPESITTDANISATSLPNVCTQIALPGMEIPGNQSEDCLYMNIYTPDTSGSLPVMFFIHGGAWILGSANQYNGTLYAKEHGVVFVATNYRLGALGFLYDGDTAPGSMGLKDQWMALKWVKENIAQFGGDPSTVTIFGESAGSGSVSYHVISPKSNGLFVRAIMESGTVLCPWAHNPLPVAKSFADQLEKNACQDEKKGMDCLRSIGTEKILQASGMIMFAPTTDGDFVPEDPKEMVKKNRYNDVTMIVGYNQGEGWMFLDMNWPGFKELSANYTNPNFVTTDELYEEGAGAVAKSNMDTMNIEPKPVGQYQVDAVVQEYSDWSPPTNPLKRLLAIGQIASDITFIVPSIEFLKNAKNAYLYEFTYVSDYSLKAWAYPPEAKWMGALHAAELTFLFAQPFSGPAVPNEADNALTKKLVKVWTDFAKTGNLPENWQKFSSDSNEAYLVIDGAEMKTVANYPRWQKRRFWNNYVPKISKCDCRNGTDATPPVPPSAALCEPQYLTKRNAGTTQLISSIVLVVSLLFYLRAE